MVKMRYITRTIICFWFSYVVFLPIAWKNCTGHENSVTQPRADKCPDSNVR